MSRAGPRARTGLILASAALMGWSAAGWASAPERAKSESLTKLGSTTSAKVSCKRGQQALAGSFDGAASSSRAIYLYRSERLGRRAWRSGGVKVGSDRRAKFEAGVVCGRLKGGVRVRKGRKQRIAADSFGAAEARCRRGEYALGASIPGEPFAVKGDGPQLFPHSSHRTGKRRWVVGAYNDARPGRLQIKVLCTREPVRERRERGRARDGTRARLKAKCPAGSSVVGGGFASSKSAFPFAVAFPYASTPGSGRAWFYGAQHQGVDRAARLTAYAYCVRR